MLQLLDDCGNLFLHYALAVRLKQLHLNKVIFESYNYVWSVLIFLQRHGADCYSLGIGFSSQDSSHVIRRNKITYLRTLFLIYKHIC